MDISAEILNDFLSFTKTAAGLGAVSPDMATPSVLPRTPLAAAASKPITMPAPKPITDPAKPLKI